MRHRCDVTVAATVVGVLRRSVYPAFRCPTCREPLAETVTQFACANGHRLDRAREGYVNLLPGGRLKGRPAGDDEAMVRARRTVLDAGLYEPIIEALAATVKRFTADLSWPAVLDCGCGEGTYLARATATADARGWGIDVSKAAVRTAARRHRGLHLAVASSYILPFEDASFDVAMSVFSPRPFAEITRVLRRGGAALVVRPGPGHLAELKALVYDDPRRHRDPLTGDGDRDDWPIAPVTVEAVRFTVDLSDAALRVALLEMTPFWWSATAERRGAVAERANTVTTEMVLAVFERPDRPEPVDEPDHPASDL